MNILNKLTLKHLKMNKKRTIVTIIGIVLSTALMVGIGTLFSSVREVFLEQAIESNGPNHVTFKDVATEKTKYIENNIAIKNTTFSSYIGYAPLEGSKNEAKPYVYLEAVNDFYFDDLELMEGRLPKNDQELVISSHISSNAEVDIPLGTTITLKIGDRLCPEGECVNGQEYAYQHVPYSTSEQLNIREQKTYTVVGIVKRSYHESYSAPGYMAYTHYDKNAKEGVTDVSVIYKNVRDVQKKSKDIAKSVDISQDDIIYHDSLLSFYGQSSYSSVNQTMTSVMLVVLGLIMIGCAIVIYNSFAISVMERKKQFGLFSSIGATKKQLQKTVYYEAIIVGIIGIPIGILCGIGGIAIVLQITNFLLPEMFSNPLSLSLYPLFISLPVLYMIVTIFVSAFLPAHRAAKISPIEAIRLNDDIKMKKNKAHKFSQKVFGIEGGIASKNMDRNKKKYRITIISLVTSIILFIAFSTFVEYAKADTKSLLEVPSYDIIVSHYNEEDTKKELFEKLKATDGIDKSYQLGQGYFQFESDASFTKDYFKYNGKGINTGTIFILDDAKFERYATKIQAKNKQNPVLVNRLKIYDYEQKTVTNFPIMKKTKEKELSLAFYSDPKKNLYETKKVNVNVAQDYPEEFLAQEASQNVILVLSETMYKKMALENEKIYKKYTDVLLVFAKEHKKVTKAFDKIAGSDREEVFVTDITEAMQMQKNMVLVSGMFLYGFITLVTLIGITSVFNTINTSIALRRREFAVLRSIGLTPKGFNKMMAYESLLYGLKALLIGIPLSFIPVWLFHQAFKNTISLGKVLIPWNAIFLTIVAVFLITFLTMCYATRKIKKENILDAIREENI